MNALIKIFQIDKILICLLLFIVTMSCAQNEYQKGLIIDSIAVENENTETFALYLPTSFNEQNLSPIVFVFDPSGNGSLGIKPFIKASEKYGLIIVCSNNSKNGPYDQNFKIFNNLFAHIYSSFKIKEQGMYLSGFSGGSRLACAIASISNLFKGVIACGAGFPQFPEYIPSTQNYAYVGLCGNRDFNYREMVENKTYLDNLGFNNALIINKGEHSWPNQDEVLKAFDWLYLEGLKSDDVQFSQDEISSLYQRDYSVALNHKENNELILAAENYHRLIDSYAVFFNLDSVRVEFEELIKSKDYKKEVKSLSRAFKTETKITNKLVSKLDSDLKDPKDGHLRWWQKQLKDLKKMEDSGHQEIKNMVFRIKFNIYVIAFSTRKIYLADTHRQQADFIDELLKMVYKSL